MRKMVIMLLAALWLLVSYAALAQSPQSLLVVDNGLLIDRRVEGSSVEDFLLPVEGPVMYVNGQSSFDGRILFLSWDEGDEQMNLSVADFDGSQERRIASGVVWAAWSPTGERFIYWDVDGALTLVEDGSSKQIASDVAGASFSPNGQLLALIRTSESNQESGGEHSGLWILDIATGEERHLTSKYNDSWDLIGYAPHWMPDGESIIFISSEGSTPFWRVNVKSGYVESLQASDEVPDPTTALFWTADGKRLFFGVEELDQPDSLWALEFSDHDSDKIVYAGKVSEGVPLGFVGSEVLISDEGSLAMLDVNMLTLRDIERPPQEESPTTGPGALYRVKFYSPLANGVWRISSWFSHNRNRTDGGPYRYNCVNFGRRNHRGTDMAASLGRNIFAGAAGTVDSVVNNCGYRDRCRTSNRNCGGGFGNHVRVRHSNGTRSYYAHMRSTTVRSGARANCRTRLGYVGSTGNSTGCHLHFELRNSGGRSVDPYRGNCNWIAQSLWVNANSPRRCP